MFHLNSFSSIELANNSDNFSPNVAKIGGKIVFTAIGNNEQIKFVLLDNEIVGELKYPPTITGVPEAISLDSDNIEVQLQISAQNLKSDIQITASDPAITLSTSVIPQNGPFPYDITISCESNEDITGNVTFTTEWLTIETPFYFIATEQPIEKAISEMTRQEVHRFLYGNDNDEDVMVLGEGFLGELKQALLRDPMAIVYADETTLPEPISPEKKNYSCVLPYYFINCLAEYVMDDIDLESYRVEQVFDDVCVIESNDHSMSYSGTFYELLMKVAEFTEIYYTDSTASPNQWKSVSTSPRVYGECDYYERRELFFDDMSIEGPAMTVFAPMAENSFEFTSAVVPRIGFELEVLFPEFDNANVFCEDFDNTHGIEAYGVENNTPTAVLEIGAAISSFTIDNPNEEEDTENTQKALVSALSDGNGNYCFRERTQADVSDNHQISCESLYGITVDIDNVVVIKNHNMELQVYYEGGDTTIEATLAMNYNGPGTKYVFYGLQGFGEKHSGERFQPYLHLIITDLTAGKVLREITATSGGSPQ